MSGGDLQLMRRRAAGLIVTVLAFSLWRPDVSQWALDIPIVFTALLGVVAALAYGDGVRYALSTFSWEDNRAFIRRGLEEIVAAEVGSIAAREAIEAVSANGGRSALMRVYYRLLDGDESQRRLQDLVRDSGYQVTVAVDVQNAALVGVLLHSLLMVAGSGLVVRAAWITLLVLLWVTLDSIVFCVLLRRHNAVCAKQIEYIREYQGGQLSDELLGRV